MELLYLQYNTTQHSTAQHNSTQYDTIFNTPQRGFFGVNYRLHYKNGRKIRGVRSVMHLIASVLLLLLLLLIIPVKEGMIIMYVVV